MTIWNGVNYPWIPDTPIVLGVRASDRVDSDLICRRSIRACFDTTPPTPVYDSDGVFRQSLVPFGQLGEYWFLENDPTAVVAVPIGCRFYKDGKQLPGFVDYVKGRAALAREMDGDV